MYVTERETRKQRSRLPVKEIERNQSGSRRKRRVRCKALRARAKERTYVRDRARDPQATQQITRLFLREMGRRPVER